MAARARNSKGHFVSGGSKKRKSGTRRRSSPSRAMVVVNETIATRPASRRPARRATSHAAHHARGHRRRRASGDGGANIWKVGASALVLANVAGRADGVAGQTVYNLVQKLPGAKTLGGAAAAGLYIGGVHRFTRIGGSLRPWMKAAGIVGVVLGLAKVGELGVNLKWLGDPRGAGGHFEFEGR